MISFFSSLKSSPLPRTRTNSSFWEYKKSSIIPNAAKYFYFECLVILFGIAAVIYNYEDFILPLFASLILMLLNGLIVFKHRDINSILLGLSFLQFCLLCLFTILGSYSIFTFDIYVILLKYFTLSALFLHLGISMEKTFPRDVLAQDKYAVFFIIKITITFLFGTSLFIDKQALGYFFPVLSTLFFFWTTLFIYEAFVVYPKLNSFVLGIKINKIIYTTIEYHSSLFIGYFQKKYLNNEVVLPPEYMFLHSLSSATFFPTVKGIMDTDSIMWNVTQNNNYRGDLPMYTIHEYKCFMALYVEYLNNGSPKYYIYWDDSLNFKGIVPLDRSQKYPLNYNI